MLIIAAIPQLREVSSRAAGANRVAKHRDLLGACWCRLSHAIAWRRSSAKRGNEEKVSESLPPWLRASTNSTLRPALRRGAAMGSICSALLPQPCSTATVRAASGREQPAERVEAAHREDAHRLEGESIAGQRTGLAHAAGAKTQMHARRDQRRGEREERAKGEYADYPRKSSWTVIRVRPAGCPARHNEAE